MIRVTSLENTCWACPAQWEGRTDDNRPVYVRYRWGSLRVDVGEPGGTVWDAIRDGETVFAWDEGDDMDGFMEFDQLQALTAGQIEWPAAPAGGSAG